jgi:hypothetical protein
VLKNSYCKFLTFSGWISLMANLVAIVGFVIERWLAMSWQPNPGFWVVLSLVTTAYALVSWSIWIWRRPKNEMGPQPATGSKQGGLLVLKCHGGTAGVNALAVFVVICVECSAAGRHNLLDSGAGDRRGREALCRQGFNLDWYDYRSFDLGSRAMSAP